MEVIRAARRHPGVFVLMNSVGTGVTITRAREIIDAGLGAWNFSVDSLDPARYEQLRGVRGALATIMQAIETVRQAGAGHPEFRLNYLTVITRDNFREIPDLVAHCVETGIASMYLMNVYGDTAGRSLLRVAEIGEFRDVVVPAILRVLREKATAEVVQANAATVLGTFFSAENSDENYAQGVYWPDLATVRAACRVPDVYTLIEPDGRVHRPPPRRSPSQSLRTVATTPCDPRLRLPHMPMCGCHHYPRLDASSPTREVGAPGKIGCDSKQIVERWPFAGGQPGNDRFGVVVGQWHEDDPGTPDAVRRLGEPGYADTSSDKSEQIGHIVGPLDDPWGEPRGGEVAVVLVVPGRPGLSGSQDPCLVGQVGELDVGSLGQRVPDGQHRTDRLRRQYLGGEIVDQWRPGERGVEPPVAYPLDQVADLGAVRDEVDVGESLSHRLYHRRQHVIGGGGQEHQIEGADLPATGALDDRDGLVEADEDRAGLGQEDPPDVRQARTAGVALEQPHPETAFEHGDLLGQRLLGQVQVPGGTAEAQLLGHGDEVAQLPQVHRHRLRL